MRDFADEVGVLKARLGAERQTSVARLRVAEEGWARALLGLPERGDLVRQVQDLAASPALARPLQEALDHLAAAEDWQWEIGTWSSGSGEGLASMWEVRTLQLAQAWLHAISGKPEGRSEALRLAGEVQGDANRIAARYDPDVQALRVRLGAATP